MLDDLEFYCRDPCQCVHQPRMIMECCVFRVNGAGCAVAGDTLRPNPLGSVVVASEVEGCVVEDHDCAFACVFVAVASACALVRAVVIEIHI